MSKKTALGVAGICVLTAVGLLVGQVGQLGDKPAPVARTLPPEAMRPTPRPERGRPRSQWLDDLEKAYEAQDMDRVGDLIGQMKQQSERFPWRRGDRGFGGPSRPMRGGMRRMQGPDMGFDIEDADLALDGQSVAKTDFEKKVLAVLNDMGWNQSRGMMNVPVADGRLLRLLAEATGARNVVEIGTSNGYSGIWLCLALRATGGRLTTFEIDAERAALARENFRKAGVDDIVTLVEGDAHEKVAQLNGSIDMVFIDADKSGYLDYVNKLLPSVRPGGLIVAHNINDGQADPEYVKAVTANPELETVFYNLGGGVSVTMKKRALP